MTRKEKTIKNCRDLYVDGYSIDRVADILNKSTGTVHQYKSQDKKNGNDWDELRAKNMKRKISKVDDKNAIQQEFIKEMYNAIKSINADKELKALEKAKGLAQVADSYSKFAKVMSKVNPEDYINNIAHAHLSLIIDVIRINPRVHDEFLKLLNEDDTYIKRLNTIKENYLDKILLEGFQSI